MWEEKTSSIAVTSASTANTVTSCAHHGQQDHSGDCQASADRTA